MKLWMFPSPCGVLVLKLVIVVMFVAETLMFPSPCGVLVLK